jgi:hypothetical protein
MQVFILGRHVRLQPIGAGKSEAADDNPLFALASYLAVCQPSLHYEDIAKNVPGAGGKSNSGAV